MASEEEFLAVDEEDSSPLLQLCRNDGDREWAAIVMNDSDEETQTEQHEPEASWIDFSDDEDDREAQASGDPNEIAQQGQDDETHAPGDPPPLKLRDYQKELAKNGLKGDNTIISAPTGSGKTRVAIHIIKEHLKTDDNEGHPKKVAFLAPTKSLVRQQFRVLRKYLPSSYEVAKVTGEDSNNRKLSLVLENFRVIAMTPEILANHIAEHGPLELRKFSVIVLDECHHTRKKGPYTSLMFAYLKIKKQQTCQAKDQSYSPASSYLPQIIGLTATICFDDADSPEKARTSILELCGKLDVRPISTVEENTEELTKTVPVPEQKLEGLTERDEDDFIEKLLEVMEVLERKVDGHIKQIQNICGIDLHSQNVKEGVPETAPKRKTESYCQWTVITRENAVALPQQDDTENEAKLRAHVRAIRDITLYLEAYNVALQDYDLLDVKEVLDCLDKRIEEKMIKQNEELFNYLNELQQFGCKDGNENPNLSKLTKVLQDHCKKGDDLRCIIFVRQRYMTEALVSWLKRCQNSVLPGLEVCSHIFTGGNASRTEGGCSQSQQETTLDLFKSGKVNLLVATSVAEEGLDIPECNLVIQYSYLGNEVQLKGRCRAVGGLAVRLIMDKDSQREADNHRKVELMTEAIACIQSLPGHETEQCIKKYQDNFFSERLREEQERENKLEKLKNEPFKLSCKGGCGTTLDGTNVRSIHGKYFVSIDREFLDAVKLSSCLMPDNFERLDDAFKIGSVCCSKPLRDSEKPCRQHVGSVVKYRKHYFVCLNKKSFMLHRASGAKRLKTWSEVPILALNEITDIPRYLQKRDSKELSKDRDTSTFVQTENGISAAKRHDRGSTQVPNTEASTERTEHFSAGAESSLGQGSVRIESPTAHRKAISELRNEALMNAAQTGNNPHNDSALYESEEYLLKPLREAPDLDMASLNTSFLKPVSEGSGIGSLKISMDSSISLTINAAERVCEMPSEVRIV